MSTLKDALCLLAILIVYGIAGHMDYEDAVAAQEIQQASLHPDHPECPTAAPSVDPERSPPTERPNNSSDWQSPGHERCPHDSGGERARQ
jgi:hypothetical protein